MALADLTSTPASTLMTMDPVGASELATAAQIFLYVQDVEWYAATTTPGPYKGYVRATTACTLSNLNREHDRGEDWIVPPRTITALCTLGVLERDADDLPVLVDAEQAKAMVAAHLLQHEVG